MISDKKIYFDLLTEWTDISIVSTHTCIYCDDEFAFTDLEKEMYDKHEFCYPDRCPTCNFRLLGGFINDRHLYNISDKSSWKTLISIFPHDYNGRVIDAIDYRKQLSDDVWISKSREVSRDIFSDFQKLYSDMPLPSRLIYPGLENCDYASHLAYAKNVYLSYCVFEWGEDIYYTFQAVGGCKNIFSSYGIAQSSNIISSMNTVKSNNVFYGEDIVYCSDMLYCKNMDNCQNCIFSCNQVNQKYMVFNTQYTKQEYEKIKQDVYLRLNSETEYKDVIKSYEVFLEKNLIQKATIINRSEKSNGDCVINSNNCINTFKANGLENCINIHSSGNGPEDGTKYFMNSTEAGIAAENCIWSCSVGMNIYNIFFSYATVEGSKNIYYCWDMENCQECMFCVGLRAKKYCILNTQYSKEEYFNKKREIITDLKAEGKWWNSLDWDLSLFPYNDTLAYDYFKVYSVTDVHGNIKVIDDQAYGKVILTWDDFISDATLDLGGKKKIKILWRTRDKEINVPEWMETIQALEIPSINQVSDTILEKAVICEETKRPYRIIKKELEFYKKQYLPLPKIHHELRVDKLVSSRPIGQLFAGICDCCGEDCLTVYKKKQKYKTYCNSCYVKNIYS